MHQTASVTTPVLNTSNTLLLKKVQQKSAFSRSSCLLFLLVVLTMVHSSHGAGTATNMNVDTNTNTNTNVNSKPNLATPSTVGAPILEHINESTDLEKKTLIIFSDIDGTLVHYPDNIPKGFFRDFGNNGNNSKSNSILKLPPSSTGMRGIISSKTLSTIQQIRTCSKGQKQVQEQDQDQQQQQQQKKQHIPPKFVLVSGMRTSTFLQRLPYLPRADAYCTEAGGRIFYPVRLNNMNNNNNNNNYNDGVFVVTPKSYDGCTVSKKENNNKKNKDDIENKHEDDNDDDDENDEEEEEDVMEPFTLVEDMEWRAKMEKLAGPFALADLKELAANPSTIPELNQRDGLLWDFARFLTSRGYVVDTNGYSACFRVNMKQQQQQQELPSLAQLQGDNNSFEALTNGSMELWDGLASSINLACVDFYPKESGKKNCCQYLAEKFCSGVNPETVLKHHAICICDDDNDVDMAIACRHAYIPEISAENMAATIHDMPDHFTVTSIDHHHSKKKNGKDRVSKKKHASDGPAATEAALALILQRIKQENEADERSELLNAEITEATV